MTDSPTILHNEVHPAWANRCDSLIHVWAESTTTHEGSLSFEQLRAQHIAGDRYLVGTIPAYARNVALGDEVRAEYSPVVGGLLATKRTVDSGHFGYRVWLGDLTEPEEFERAIEALHRAVDGFGCSLAHPTNSLVAVDAPNETSAALFVSWLEGAEAAGQLIWETANDSVKAYDLRAPA